MEQLHVAISSLGWRFAPAAHLLHADTGLSHNVNLRLDTDGTTEAVWWCFTIVGKIYKRNKRANPEIIN